MAVLISEEMSSHLMYEGFTHEVVSVEEAQIALIRAGTGPTLLLLHGYPQTKAAWHRVAPQLAARFTVVIPDLPGYGDSIGPPPDKQRELYSKRAMARLLVSLMRTLGHEQFAVAGHDRGGRVAYRMALDHPDRIVRLAVLDVIPTLDMVEQLTYELAWHMGNWFFLAQPPPMPETLIEQMPDFYLNHILDQWLGTPGSLAAEARAEYVRCFRKPTVIRAACEDYRAGFGPDLEHDHADRAQGRRITCPVLVLWASKGLTGTFFNPVSIWKRWADDVTGQALSCGHFLMEEAPEEVSTALATWITRGSPHPFVNGETG